MRIVSWNIRLGLEVDSAIESLTTHPDLQGADLILLQEMDDAGPELIADALGLQSVYRFGCTAKETGKPFGNAILVRGEVGESEMFNLPHAGRFFGLRSRVATRAVVTVDPGSNSGPHQMSVWSVHAEIPTLPHRLQLAQYRAIAEQARAATTVGAIVGGDFNTASRRSVNGLVERMSREGMTRVLPAGQRTFFRFGRPFELDHLFARGFSVLEAGVVRAHNASDHDPVWAVLEAT